jgi:geranylgeranyl diphosphate synthase type II
MVDRDEFAVTLDALRVRVDARLTALTAHADGRLGEAVRYALLAPAKRLRPILCALSARAFGGDDALAIDPGCAVEMVHTASLVLDDLPCMDDALLRRGRPAAHVVFGEDTAILAAVALLNEAFAVAGRAPGLPADHRLRLLGRLTGAVGFNGLVAGQHRDLREGAPERTVQGLASLNHQKTGVLFVTAAETGACLAGAGPREIDAVGRFAAHLGQAFQIRDDLIDARLLAEDAGKDCGKDAGKTTLVSLVGHERARAALEAELELAREALFEVGVGGPLLLLTERLACEPPAAVAPLVRAASQVR